MKIEQKEAVFSPVVITLETQEEVDQMYSLVYWSCIASNNKEVEIDIKIENYLSDKASSISPKYTPDEDNVLYLKEKEVD